MEEENKVNGGSPTPNGEGQTSQTKAEPFSDLQQEKVNSLIKEERIKILEKLGAKSVEEVRQRLNATADYETLKEKATKYDEQVSAMEKLEGQNAMLSVGIDEDMQGIVEGYFKGTGTKLTKENLTKLLDEKPRLKEQWVSAQEGKGKPNPTIIGNPQPNNPPSKTADERYAEFIRKAERKF